MDFKEQKEYVKTHKKIDVKHFNTVNDITNMIDFINKEREDEVNKHAKEEVASISRFLEKIAKSKTFVIKVKP